MTGETRTMAGMRVAIGGLMRCCTGTLNNLALVEAAATYERGQVIPCEHCTATMIVGPDDWIIRWNHP